STSSIVTDDGDVSFDVVLLQSVESVFISTIESAYTRRFQSLKASSSNRTVFNGNQFIIEVRMLRIASSQVVMNEQLICNEQVWFRVFSNLKLGDVMRLSYVSKELNTFVLNYLKTLKEINFTEFVPLQLQLSDESRQMFQWVLQNCAGVRELKEVISASYCLTSMDFTMMSNLCHLTVLDLSGCIICCDNFSDAFSQLINLKHLNLSHVVPLEASATVHFEYNLKLSLRNFKKMERSDFVQGWCLDALDCTALQKLSICPTSLNLREVINVIRRCEQLRDLQFLNRCNESIDATCLIELLQLKNVTLLKRLSIGYKVIENLHTLGNELWTTIRKFVNLNCIEMFCRDFVEMIFVEQIKVHFPNLHSLAIETSAINSILILYLLREGNFKELSLVNTRECRRILDGLVLNNRVYLNIRRLGLHNFYWKSSLSLHFDRAFPNLEELSISGDRLTGETLLSIDKQFYEKLKVLHFGLMDLHLVRSVAVNRILGLCINLEKLALTDRPLTDGMARTLIERCRKLKEVVICRESHLCPVLFNALRRTFFLKYCN
ncbi:hypothetical protein T4D_14881, partial [Trichinella pseudospiralis]